MSVMRVSRGNQWMLAPLQWRARLSAEGWRLHDAEPGDPEVTEPTPLSSLPVSSAAADLGTHAPGPVAAAEPSKRRGRRGAA